MSIAPATNRGARQTAIRRTVASLPTQQDMVTNILTTIGESTDDQWHRGMAWYAEAHAIAEDLAHDHSTSVEAACGVIAALSPQTSWAENIVRAGDYLDHGTTTHFVDAVRKCDRITDGEHPADVLGGRKVRSFFHNVSQPHKGGAVTIDRHAVTVACGKRQDVKVLERIGAYAYIAAAYRKVARLLDILPHQAQAIAWVVWTDAHRWERDGNGEDF